MENSTIWLYKCRQKNVTCKSEGNCKKCTMTRVMQDAVSLEPVAVLVNEGGEMILHPVKKTKSPLPKEIADMLAAGVTIEEKRQ